MQIIDITEYLPNKFEENMQHQLTTLNGSSKHTQISQPQILNSDLTPIQYQQKLEALLFQKAAQGEDVEPCINALNYFVSQNKQLDLLNKVYTDAKKELSVFSSVQRVAITVFAILGMIGVFNWAFTQARHNPASVNAPVQAP
ncbi:hypothetical protein H6G80_30030 [Nostoc sp. FACHB-87]|nr:hypothetical protein [Nostoc sp. FACHB-87]